MCACAAVTRALRKAAAEVSVHYRNTEPNPAFDMAIMAEIAVSKLFAGSSPERSCHLIKGFSFFMSDNGLQNFLSCVPGLETTTTHLCMVIAHPTNFTNVVLMMYSRDNHTATILDPLGLVPLKEWKSQKTNLRARLVALLGCLGWVNG